MKVVRSVLLSILLLAYASLPASLATGEQAGLPAESSLPDLIKKMEARRGTWTGMKAALSIQFTADHGKQAACQGTLIYHRLDEKILLQCYREQNRLVFLLKTTDREFELYLPAQRTLYKGNIFTLEDSPAIESHLRAWDLYRAFKPMVIPLENIELQKGAGSFFGLIQKRNQLPSGIARELTISPEGDIVSEIYYDLTGSPSVEIQRSGFQEMGAATAGMSTAYPRQIRILSYHGNEGDFRETIFEFKQAAFLADLSEKDFEVSFPENTTVLVLEDTEKNQMVPGTF